MATTCWLTWSRRWRSRFTLAASDQPLYVYGDLARLEQVFRNLLSNAVRYSPAGTEVRVGCIVRRHNGRIWAQSRENEGGTFYAELPRVAPPQGPPVSTQ